MAELVGIDEAPSPPVEELGEDGKVQCPECDVWCKPGRGLKLHLAKTHGQHSSPQRSTGDRSGKASTDALAESWKDFQMAAAMLVSLACSQCGAVLVEDAAADGKAIAQYAEKHAAFRKRIKAFLDNVDIFMLMGALMGTGMKMMQHHSIADRIPFMQRTDNTTGDHAQHDPMRNMAQFMSRLPEETRHQIIDRAFATMGGMPGYVPGEDNARIPATDGTDSPSAEHAGEFSGSAVGS